MLLCTLIVKYEKQKQTRDLKITHPVRFKWLIFHTSCHSNLIYTSKTHEESLYKLSVIYWNYGKNRFRKRSLTLKASFLDHCINCPNCRLQTNKVTKRLLYHLRAWQQEPIIARYSNHTYSTSTHVPHRAIMILLLRKVSRNVPYKDFVE